MEVGALNVLITIMVLSCRNVLLALIQLNKTTAFKQHDKTVLPVA